MKNELMMFERRGAIVVSSRDVAERFGKSHSDVLRAIKGSTREGKHVDGLIDGIRSNVNTSDLYFVESSYKDGYGRSQTEYFCTRDGFSLLVMGFTGQRALEWKIKYIEAFNRMEAALNERSSTEWLITRKQGKLIRRGVTDMIADLIEYAEAQGSHGMRKNAYTIYTKLVNSLVGIETGQRGEAPFKTLTTIAFLEDMIMHTIAEDMALGVYYKEIYKHCLANGQQIIRFAYLPKLTA